MSISQRVAALRAWMRKNDLSAYIFPSTDPHSGEYIPDHWKSREWISGFNGSAGTAVVTLTAAGLWTDSRYWLAAEEQLKGTPFEVIRCSRNVATAEELVTWIKKHLQSPMSCPQQRKAVSLQAIGLDAWTNTAECVKSMERAATSAGFTLRTDVEPTASLWTNRPILPNTPIEIQPQKYAGRSVSDKLSDIRCALGKNGADALLVTQLDDIAWALNLRGRDVHCTPVFVSYLLVLPQSAVLFVDCSKIPHEVAVYLQDNGIVTQPYDAVHHYTDWLQNGQILQLDRNVVNQALDIPDAIEAPSPIPMLRAIKNEVEIAGFRQAMLRDGIALVKFLRWMSEQSFADGGRQSEISIDKKLTSLRAEQPGFRDISFDTIAGYGAHAAIVHYEATPETDIPLAPRGLLLLDSGAQYDCGTTDITRTIALGPLTDEERRDYTLVLKGHIRLATAVFPEGTTGTQLDVLARYAMWQEHKNYGHGTGHGVGSYLSVHEGPHQFRMNWMPAPLQAGMTVTIEPGIYIAGSHGCRTENTMLIVQDGEGWLRLEPLTLCPIDTTPIIRELMTADELDYLNNYHARVREALLPLLTDEKDCEWLISQTDPVQ